MSNKFLKLASIPIMNLDHIKRYSGTKLVEEETLSQHIVDTIMLGIKMIDDINDIISSKNRFSSVEEIKANQLSPEVYVMKAIYHDLEEAITGDVPRPLKYYDEATTSSLKHVAHQVAEDFFRQQFNRWKSHYDVWEDAKEGKEGYILKVVDTLVVANKVVKEVSLLNNNYMLRVAHEVSQYLRSLVQSTKANPYFDEYATKYLVDIIKDAIDAMEELLEEHQSILLNLNICKQSMI